MSAGFDKNNKSFQLNACLLQWPQTEVLRFPPTHVGGSDKRSITRSAHTHQLRLSPHPALQGATCRAGDQPQCVILVPCFAFSLPLHYRATATNGSPERHRAMASHWSAERYSPGPLRPGCGSPALRLLWGLRRSQTSSGDDSPPYASLPRSQRSTLRDNLGRGTDSPILLFGGSRPGTR